MYEVHFHDLLYSDLKSMQSWAKEFCGAHESLFLEPYFNSSSKKTYGFFSFENKKDADFFSLKWGSDDYKDS